MEYPPKDEAEVLEEPKHIKKETHKEKRVLTINEHGLSQDYLNEFNLAKGWINDLLDDTYDKNNADDLIDLKIIATGLNKKFQNKELKKYTERLREEEYGNVKNEKNKELIEDLDEKIEELYSTMNGVNLTPENINAHKNELREILALFDDVKSIIEDGVSRRIAA